MYIWGEIIDDDFIYLHRFAVAERHHGKKIGSEILEWINNYCFDKRVNLRFDCVGSNIRLNQYYINHGFKLVETKHDHSKYEKRY